MPLPKYRQTVAVESQDRGRQKEKTWSTREKVFLGKGVAGQLFSHYQRAVIKARR
jgi:hypothetical protein